ncbi:MAG: hypothetical protein WCW44_05100 [archaeon]|jgi:hypothetical protein
MKIHYPLIGLMLLTAFVLLGCTQLQQNNLPASDENTLSSEIDASWITDENSVTNDMIATDQDLITSEATILDENQIILIGDMI